MWLTWGRRLDKPAGALLPQLASALRRGQPGEDPEHPKQGFLAAEQDHGLPMALTGNTPPHRPTRRREQGRPEGPPVRYPQGSDNRGNLAATRGAALSTASGALLLTRRAHNCGAH